MTMKNEKTVLFASLMAAILIPLGAMNSAEAERIPVFVEPVEVKIQMTEERQNLLDQVQEIGERAELASDDTARNAIISELDPLKDDMKRLGLTPSFEFGEDREEWDNEVIGMEMIKVTFGELIDAACCHTDNWHVKHELKWGCNPFVYCTDTWTEWYDLYDWSAITVTLPTVQQSYIELKHKVTNFTGSSQTETMNGWGTQTRGANVIEDNYDGDVEFWFDHEVESEIILVSWDVQTGDKVYSTSRIT